MYIISYLSSKIFTKDIIYANYHLIVDAYSKLTIFYLVENITTEEVIDWLDIIQARFRKVDRCG